MKIAGMNFQIRSGRAVFCVWRIRIYSALDISEKEMAASFFLMNIRPNDPGPQLLEIAADAFCR